ncbi:MAG: hypothetical protein GC136_07980 [Alphaproteobacteria bacterium]|nr:hypothetical protein [Alphaproteobacteria bacterium]
MEKTGHHIIIQPQQSRPLWEDITELWHARALVWVFAWREISVRYKQALIGFLWVFLQPVIMTAIFTFVFSHVAKIQVSGNYPVFVLCGLILWQYFSRSVFEGCNAMVKEKLIITKIYFPRAAIIVAPHISNFLDALIALLVLVALMLLTGTAISPMIFLMPVFLVMAGLLSIGVSLVIAPLQAMYRDFAIIMPFLIQLAMFASPVFYPATSVPENLTWFFMVNPLSGLLEGMRWAAYGAEFPHALALVSTALWTIGLCVGGLYTFRILQGRLVDRL